MLCTFYEHTMQKVASAAYNETLHSFGAIARSTFSQSSALDGGCVVTFTLYFTR